MCLMNGMLLYAQARKDDLLSTFLDHPVLLSDTAGKRRYEWEFRTNQEGLVPLEDEWETALFVEDEATLEEAFMIDTGVSIETATGKIPIYHRLQQRNLR